MKLYIYYAVILIGAYLVGAFPSGYIFYRMKTGKDIRKIGLRKNIGTTNVFVNGGIKVGVATLICDIAKGTIPVLIVQYITGGHEVLMIFAGVLTVIGHVFPVYIGFRGGTGLATSMGALIALMPVLMLTYAVLFVIVTPIIRRPSLLGLILMLIMPFYAYMLDYSGLLIGISTVMGIMYLLISLNHIKSMLLGNEYKEVMSLLRQSKQ